MKGVIVLLAHEFCTASQEELASDISYAFLKGRKYIEIPDDIILCYMNSGEAAFKAQWDYIGNAHCGLNYHGITIILNADLDDFTASLKVLSSNNNIQSLRQLCDFAKIHNQAIIHFGI